MKQFLRCLLLSATTLAAVAALQPAGAQYTQFPRSGFLGGTDGTWPCGQFDDGATESAIGLSSGGEIGWGHNYECMLVIDEVLTAYGSPQNPSTLNGSGSRIAVYEDGDCDGDPTTGPATLLWSAFTVITNANTDILNSNPTGGIVVPSGCSFVAATASHVSGRYPAPIDATNATFHSWIFGQPGGELDLVNLLDNSLPPEPTYWLGGGFAWLLRARGAELSGDFPVQCFGTSDCPCDNESHGGGCVNGTGVGAVITASGDASLTADTLVLSVSGTSNSLGLFFQGDNVLPSPPRFGDGLRCCQQDMLRIGTYLASGNATNTANGTQTGGIGPPISTLPGQDIQPGETRCYQYWYRDQVGPCGSGFNTSSSVLATWAP